MANTPEYRTILQLTSELTTAFENDLIKLGGELLAQGLIASNNAADVRNPHNNAGHRAAILMGCIRNRIELDPKGNYQVFINVLKQRVADHKEILQMLDGKYKELGESMLHRLPIIISFK